ncbi:TROVE domain-containing protein [Jidongwangia harbinensis]|uniref:TROVE domain-containing protein n=1 Tax=Jidongwangia harbinensis TaxID=2878561 RepID=UPI001CD9A55D|nr:TROVE domain-containing protein [Jidongwangia harbinensis]MCA2214196.1 TROVE domain-containing protein [Jidongwangia harbinensis]
MTKFNIAGARSALGRGPVTAEHTASGRTHTGGAGFAHDAKSELFLLAVANLAGEDTYYEKAADRDRRYAGLVQRVTVADPAWTARFLRWLRTEGNLRSASLVGALEAAKAMRDHGIPGGRAVVDSVLQRADEPGEALAYWMSVYGRAVPKPVKRGVADAVARLYRERSLLKYDTASHGFRFGDVIDLTHPSPATGRAWQGALFGYALDRRHGRDTAPPAPLSMLTANAELRRAAERDPSVLLDPDALARAGMTWEDALSLAGAELDKARLWTALIPGMGYMALLRNLRNFDQAGVGDDVAAQVCARLADPAQVARSRQFPFRFLAAYEQAPSLRWGGALDRALQLSLSNLPALPGRSLVLVDTSASMSARGFSRTSTMTPVKAAAVFGVALAARGERVDLHGFADGVFRHPVPAGASVIREVDRFVRRVGEVGHGTRIAEAVRATLRGHDRVFVISDMQTFAPGPGTGEVTAVVPRHTPLYGFNLGGYTRTAFDAGAPNRIEFGGLTDATFRMVPLIEAGRNADWPF